MKKKKQIKELKKKLRFAQNGHETFQRMYQSVTLRRDAWRYLSTLQNEALVENTDDRKTLVEDQFTELLKIDPPFDMDMIVLGDPYSAYIVPKPKDPITLLNISLGIE